MAVRTRETVTALHRMKLYIQQWIVTTCEHLPHQHIMDKSGVTVHESIAIFKGRLAKIRVERLLAIAIRLDLSPRVTFAQDPAHTPTSCGVLLTDPSGQFRKFDDIEYEIIRKAIALCGGDISAAARQLGVGRSTIYRKMGSVAE